MTATESSEQVERWPRWWEFWLRKPQYRDAFPTSLQGKQSTPNSEGKWRFSRFDGRYVYDYDDGRRGFGSPTWFDVDPFAKYVNDLESRIARLPQLEAKAALLDDYLALQQDESFALGQARSLVDLKARYYALSKKEGRDG